MRRAILVAAASLVALVLPAGVAPPSAQTGYPIGTYTAQTSVTAFVDAAKATQDAGFGSYANPSPNNYVPMTEVQTWRAAVGIQQALVGDYQAASNTLGRLGLSSYWLTSSTGRVYFIVKEATSTKGWSSLVIYPQATRNIAVAAPHVTHDTDSHTSARVFFLNLRAKMLVVSGAFKCNNLAVSGCTHVGSTSCAGLANDTRNVSDLNHDVTNLMHAAAMAARNTEMTWWSIHSNAASTMPDLGFGDGSVGRTTAPVGSVVRRARTALGAAALGGITIGACNAPEDAAVAISFCTGIDNDTQGRLINGNLSLPFSATGTACTTNVTTALDRVVLWELKSAARTQIAGIVSTLATVYPVDLPGSGL